MSDASAKKVSKAKKQVKLAEHPKYSDMIKAAILALKERTGSSRQAIVKYIKENYKVGDNAGVHVRTALKKMLTAKLLVQTKGTGASGSYHIHGGYSLALGVLGVGNSITDHVLQKDLENTAGLFVNQT